jgi:hypothetical protein
VSDFGSLEVLLLNNVNDTDSVLQELAFVCKKLKCLELNKCREFQGDGLQDIIDQCTSLETLQLGKQIFPTLTEFNEINWSDLKHKLKELSITTKFPSLVETRFTASNSDANAPENVNPHAVYSNTLFNYLNECNQLKYLALADFTLKFPNDECLEPQIEKALTTNKTEHCENVNGLKYLYLRNIRNVKCLSANQSTNLQLFLNRQHSLHTLDLTGLYLGSDFVCQILGCLSNLRVFNFGHGKSYKKSAASSFRRENFDSSIDIDAINCKLSANCRNLTNLGIFNRQCELKFKRDPMNECKNEALIDLLKSCIHMKQISYLKSFKIQDDDFDENGQDDDDADFDEEEEEDSRVQVKRRKIFNETRPKNYFHFIKYAIQNASAKSNHVNMQPCYGYDMTPSSGHLLDQNGGFIETTLPLIMPPINDFHTYLMDN